jgi:HEAT repeat protein
VDSSSAFVQRFGDLVALLRADPGNDAAQDLALAAAASAVEAAGVEVEAGIHWSVIPDDLTLKSRLLARQVEAVRVAAGAEPHELLALARALSHDLTPIPSSSHIEVELVQPIGPPPLPPSRGGQGSIEPPQPGLSPRAAERRNWHERRLPGPAHHRGIDRRQGTDRRAGGERRLQLVRSQRVEIERLHDALERSIRSLAWEAVLGTVLALVRLVPRLPVAERRSFGIQLRRAVPRPALEALVELAERDTALRADGVEVLCWIGLDAAEPVLGRLVEGDAPALHGFYYDVLTGIPGLYRLVTPLLTSHYAHEIRHGAALLGRLGRPDAVGDLVPLLLHPDRSVRAAAIDAIGRIHEGPAAEPLRRALRHPDSHTRAAAAEAIAVWRGGVLALLLAGALETERDRGAWQALVTALGRIGAPESCTALAGVAVTRRSLLRREGYTTGQRLAAVTALGLADSPASRLTLERLASGGEAVIRYAADRVLRAERQRAG